MLSARGNARVCIHPELNDGKEAVGFVVREKSESSAPTGMSKGSSLSLHSVVTHSFSSDLIPIPIPTGLLVLRSRLAGKWSVSIKACVEF
jgi:hypothetical protein